MNSKIFRIELKGTLPGYTWKLKKQTKTMQEMGLFEATGTSIDDKKSTLRVIWSMGEYQVTRVDIQDCPFESCTAITLIAAIAFMVKFYRKEEARHKKLADTIERGLKHVIQK